ncbi:hypothetical protein Q7P37_005933 [Cladosporium fusiforme]
MAASWEQHKETIRTLYLVRDYALKDVVLHMREQHNFEMSEQQYGRQFKKWGFRKNSTGDNWKLIHRKRDKRQKQGKKSLVYHGGRLITSERLSKERRHDFRMPGVLYESAASPKTPEGFVICTPKADSAPFILLNNLPSFQLYTQFISFAPAPRDTSSGSTLHAQASRSSVLDSHSQFNKLGNVHESPTRYFRSDSMTHNDGHVLVSEEVQNSTSNDYSRLALALSGPQGARSLSLSSQEVLNRICQDQAMKPLLHMIHLASNDLLDRKEAYDAFGLIGNNNRGIFNALLSRPSPATKAIARTFLPMAIECSDISMIKTMLDTGIQVNSPVNFAGDTLLHLTARVEESNLDVMKFLLDRGADPNAGDMTKETPLVAAVPGGRVGAIELLLRHRADVNGRSTQMPIGDLIGQTPLLMAVRHQHIDLVRLLLCHGADVNAQVIKHSTALNEAVKRDSTSIVQLLLYWGADPTTTLPIATAHGHTELLQCLIDNGADVDAPACCERKYRSCFMTALQIEASKSDYESVLFLLEHGADVNAPLDEWFGLTALQAAASSGNIQLLHVLIDSGAEINALPAKQGGRTALQAAASNGNAQLAQRLIESGAEINASPAVQGGMTSLQAAIRSGNIELIRMLINMGAVVNETPAWAGCMTILEAASLADGTPEIVQLLLDSQIDLNTQGGPAVAIAASSGNLPVLKLLLSSGADANGISRSDHCSALEIAALMGRYGRSPQDTLEMTKLLLDFGATDTTKALMLAVGNNFKLVKLLLSAGADVNADSAYGDKKTVLSITASTGDLGDVQYLLDCGAAGTTGALQAAASCGRVHVARLLINVGADVNNAPLAFRDSVTGTKFSKTALQGAASCGSLELVRLLLDAGAHPDIETSPNEEATALQFAAIRGDIGIVVELLEQGADVNASPRGEYGRTALEGAAEHGRLDIVQLLLNVQAKVEGTRALEFAQKEGHNGVVEILREYLHRDSMR